MKINSQIKEKQKGEDKKQNIKPSAALKSFKIVAVCDSHKPIKQTFSHKASKGYQLNVNIQIQ